MYWECVKCGGIDSGDGCRCGLLALSRNKGKEKRQAVTIPGVKEKIVRKMRAGDAELKQDDLQNMAHLLVSKGVALAAVYDAACGLLDVDRRMRDGEECLESFVVAIGALRAAVDAVGQ